jgi:hypothetical protein
MKIFLIFIAVITTSLDFEDFKTNILSNNNMMVFLLNAVYESSQFVI